MSEQSRTEVKGNGHAHATPEELEQEMAATRAEMNETLAALGNRLSPEALLNQAMQQFGGPGEFATNLSNAIKRNPVPATLTGIGLSWLMVAHRQGWDKRYSQGPSSGQLKQRGAGIGQSGKETVGRAGERASESAHEMRDRVQEFNARTRAQLSKATESAKSWTGRAQSQGGQVGSQASGFFYDQPLVVGALAVGLGALAGAAIQKRSEPRALTRQREEMTRRAKETASEAVKQGSEIAETAGHAAAEKTKEVSSRETEHRGRGPESPSGTH